jgi:anthranilate synthase component II
VQFHPESIASEHGHLILKNFLDLAAGWNAATGRRSPDRPNLGRAH